MNRKYLILDCNYLCHRTKHAMGSLSHGGVPTEVIYGFLKTVLHLQKIFDTQHVIFCWDSKTNKRMNLFPAYKQKRRKKVQEYTDEEMAFEVEFRSQMKKLRLIYLRKIGFNNIFFQKGYESDDIMASVCVNSISSEDDGIIVTADQDLYQCIAHNIKMHNPHKAKTLSMQGFTKQYGIIPAAWPFVKAIAGCSSDEVPGVYKVGEKTAIKYLRNELKKTTKAYQAITSREGRDIETRNIPLVRLPFKGTKVFKIKEDNVTQQGWEEVSESLGMSSIKDRAPINKKRKSHGHRKKQRRLV